MGRHSLPDDSASGSTGARSRARRRTVAVSTALVLAVAAGTVVALRGDLLSFKGPCEDKTMRLDVVASPDIAPALEEVAGKARAQRVRTDGKCLDVKVTARAAYEVADSLIQNGDGGRGSGAGPKYQVWVPDSRLWVDRVTAESTGAGTDTDADARTDAGTGTVAEPVGKVATSPVVLGATPTAAASLGWPRRTYTWPELTRAAMSGDALRLGAADPARSATGLLALARIHAGSIREATSREAAGTRTAAAAKALHQRVADGDGQVLATLPHDDSGAERGNPRRNQALLLSEQAAYAHNTGRSGGPGLKLFYPKDGTAHLDYPYTLLSGDRLSPDQSRAANRFMTLLGDTEGQRALRERGFRAGGTGSIGSAGGTGSGGADRDRAVAEVARTAGGRAPQPYGADPADPPSARELRALLGMWTITVQSARLTTVVDVSASMATPVPGQGGRSRMDLAKNSLLQGLAAFTPDDEIGLWKFATRLDGRRDYLPVSPTDRLGDPGRAGGGTHREDLSAAFGSLTPVPGGATGLYDTVLAAYEQACQTYASGKFNGLVLLTDGANDDADGIGLDALAGKLKELSDRRRPVPLIAVAIGPDADKSALDRIVGPTGGSAHRVNDPSQIHEVILKAIMAAGSTFPH
ncbi:substrate-binding domain-containing protein [Streptomyces sp. MST-110588]|uniref:substrate-binding domain-containing protein n=1 Tax=Streptomyces sp. MST-110588 TaxID=2833628 RepID=UPI001F5E3354|nr:substrate-binding domain-containing protein [Streptomyces sp. MST-110588]UNO38744.1 VWA domain-containing protein [Streptomyces sp. MST-110588]